MDRIEQFVDEIANTISTIGTDDLFMRGQPISLVSTVIIKLGLDRISEQFAEIVGVTQLESFYEGCQPNGRTVTLRLGLPLARTVPTYCAISESGSLCVDTQGLCDALRSFADCVATGVVPYSLSLRLTNFDIENDTELSDGIRFRKISTSTLKRKYPIESQFVPLSQMERHWANHRIELVVEKQGTAAELESWSRIEKSDAFINSILHSFLLADVPHGNLPSATHFVVSSPIEGHCHYRGQGGMCFTPKVLTEQELDRVRRAFSLLELSKDDRVLETSIDRFVLGPKRGTHHPNRVNQPNWDKIVDYVIALETLFLTVENNAMAQELAYRFRLNGTSLLTRSHFGQPHTIFTALKSLYELRSKVVHGCGDATVLKAANKFIEVLGIDRDQHKHSIGRIMIVSEKVEEWITTLFFVLSEMPVELRPYREKQGWENMLWAKEEEES